MPVQAFSDGISVKIFWPWPCDPRRPCPQRFESWSYETETSAETHYDNNNNLIKFIYRESIMIFLWKHGVFLCLFQSHTWFKHLQASQKLCVSKAHLGVCCLENPSWCHILWSFRWPSGRCICNLCSWQQLHHVDSRWCELGWEVKAGSKVCTVRQHGVHQPSNLHPTQTAFHHSCKHIL